MSHHRRAHPGHLAERCIHDRTCFLVGVRPLAHVRVQRDGRRGVAEGELDPLNARAVVDRPGSEVVTKAVQANTFGKACGLRGGYPDVCPARAVKRAAPARGKEQFGGTKTMLAFVGVRAVPARDFDGQERAPMRMVEARITLGVVRAREGAVSLGMRALEGDRNRCRPC